ncbi:MAG: hypothetical protein JRI72_02865 [Deltaproteobacteria bacterium]|nr:hypothetical protein [Deltaproteobacteria bacterium]
MRKTTATTRRVRFTTIEPTLRPARVKNIEPKEKNKEVAKAASSPM